MSTQVPYVMTREAPSNKTGGSGPGTGSDNTMSIPKFIKFRLLSRGSKHKMAVFTEVSNTQLDELLSHYDIGQARSLKGIASGIENSNFYLDTDKGKYVLTIFERLNKDQLPYYLKLTSHLGKKCLAVSYPIPRKDGGLLSEINGKPCSIAPCLSGTYVENLLPSLP